MLTTASCWREGTRCFCFASPSNFAFTWATGITVHINSCLVKCGRNVASPILAGDSFGHARTSGTCAHPVQNNGVEPDGPLGANVRRPGSSARPYATSRVSRQNSTSIVLPLDPYNFISL